jgi:hypothetical protein
VAPWLALGWLALSPVSAASAQAHPRGLAVARAARVISVQETGHLNAVSPPGVSVEEKGRASGTYNCPITVHLTLTSATRAIASFTVRPRGGALSGRAFARFAQQNGNGYFGGSLTITRGTGSFAHASAAGMGISGVINRESDTLTVHVNGKLRL